ncbi:MAG: hypothetical protein J3T61_00615 [Candidatus Brocadiales bacterium]|nr:hypothetical protein [Candidatus Bathyanammoxibius sp.]
MNREQKVILAVLSRLRGERIFDKVQLRRVEHHLDRVLFAIEHQREVRYANKP